ncbi:MAG: putative polyketide synthase [Cyanobacteria bacterium RYN_339]|nr:putative polyketide synthase [Cyanobacteria bacterium RYN_339]
MTNADELLAWFRTYAERRLNSRLADERRTIPPYVVLDLGNQGFLGLQAPEAVGGLALPTTELVRVLEQVSAVDMTLALLLGVHNGLGIRPIQQYGQPALQARLLPRLATGRELAAFALTEPGAGSHPLAMQATARRVEGGWRVDAHKHWIGLGSWAGVVTVVAKTVDPPGVVALAVLADNPGLVQGPEALTMGVRGLVQNTVYLRDAFVPDEAVLGRPGGGLAVAQDAMMVSRLGIAAVALGGLKRCAQLMARYATRRMVGTGRLLDNAVTRAILEDTVGAIAAGEALVRWTARLADGPDPVPQELYLACKIALPELLGRAVDGLTQLLGGRGYVEANGVPQLLRDARLLRVFEGPTETLLVHLGTLANGRPKGCRALLPADLAEEALGACVVGDDLVWSDFRAGQVMVAALLLAAGGPASWARQNFDRACRPIAAPVLPVEALCATIDGYKDAIGDVEQTLPGEDSLRDPLLRRDP